MSAEEFLIKWISDNNTEDDVYAAYHIDAMEAYAKEQVQKELHFLIQDAEPLATEIGDIQMIPLEVILDAIELNNQNR